MRYAFLYKISYHEGFHEYPQFESLSSTTAMQPISRKLIIVTSCGSMSLQPLPSGTPKSTAMPSSWEPLVREEAEPKGALSLPRRLAQAEGPPPAMPACSLSGRSP